MEATNHEFTRQILGAQQSLLNFALKLTANPVEASDLVQDTTLKALHASERYADNANFTGWIMTIMRNTFLNNCRSHTRSQAVVDTSADIASMSTLAMQSQAPNPESVYSANQINTIIRQLPDSYRLPFTMHIEGYKYSEIAEKLNLPLGVVKSHILQTRRKLRAILSED